MLEKIYKFYTEFAGILISVTDARTDERTPNILGVETEDHLIMETFHKFKKKKFPEKQENSKIHFLELFYEDQFSRSKRGVIETVRPETTQIGHF